MFFKVLTNQLSELGSQTTHVLKQLEAIKIDVNTAKSPVSDLSASSTND